MLQQSVSFSRRRTSRVETLAGVWVYWGCGRRDDVSRVRNLGPGGLFVETREPNVVGASARLEFLVQEGAIRAEAVVRHVASGRGVGLKFTAIRDEDCPHLAALLNRVKHSS